MAQLERLIARIEADTTILRREMQRAGVLVEQSAGRIDRNLKRVDSRFDGLGASARRLQGVLATLGLAFGAREFIQAADTMTLISSRLNLVSKSTAEATRAQEALFDIAQETRVSFEATADLYARVARSSTELGVTQEELLDVTKAINQAVLVSGATSAETSAGLVQFSQGLASGALRGDELRSVLEQLPRLARALADGLGIPIGKLREMGEAGELTAEKVIGALKSQFATLEAEAGRMERTVAQAFTQLQNALLRSIGLANDASDGMSSLTQVLDELRQVVDSEGFQAGMNFLVKAIGAIAEEAAEGVAQLGRLVNLANDPSWENLKAVFGGTVPGRIGQTVQDVLPSGAASDGQVRWAQGPGGGPWGSGFRGLAGRITNVPGAAPAAAPGAAPSGTAMGRDPVDAMAALGALQQVEAEMQKARQEALDAIAEVEDSYLQSTGQQIALIQRRTETELAALDDLLLSEEEKERLRRIIIMTSDAEIAAHRRQVHDAIKKAQEEELDLVRAIGDEVENRLHTAMRGHIQDWSDVKRVGLDALDSILQRWIDMQIEMSKVKGQSEDGGWGGLLGLLGSAVTGLGGFFFGGGSTGVPYKGTGTPGSGGAGFAMGGEPAVNQPSIVGEEGPEVFVPKVAGRVYTAGETAAMRGGGGNTFVVQEAPITINGSTMDEARLSQILRAHRQETVNEVAKLARRGGSYAKAFAA